VFKEVAMSRLFWLLAAILCSLTWLAAAGAEGPILTPIEAATSAEIAALIDKLDDTAFATRQQATERLSNLGSLVTTQLEVAAGAASREVASRAFQILKHHFQNSDETNRDAAKAALAHLAESADVATAQRARDILNPPRPVATSNRWGPPPPIPPPFNNAGRNVFGGNIAGGLRRVSVGNAGGKKTIEIDDRERSIVFTENQPGGAIEAQITDRQNAGNPVRKVAARDLADLRRKDADLARLFEQYGDTNRHVAGLPAVNPAPFPAMPPPRTNPADALRLQLQSLDAILYRYKQRAQTDPNAQRMVEALEQTKARMQTAKPSVTR
jgi:hypothetical protein